MVLEAAPERYFHENFNRQEYEKFNSFLNSAEFRTVTGYNHEMMNDVHDKPFLMWIGFYDSNSSIVKFFMFNTEDDTLDEVSMMLNSIFDDRV